MTRYFTQRKTATKPRADWIDDDGPMLRDLYVPDHEATDTGLVDSKGDSIMRAPNPMGFIW